LKTKIINFVSGPSSGKSLFTSLVYSELRIKGFVAEVVPELAKWLVWTKQFELLNNQYYVSHEQYKTFKALNKEVEFIVTDGSLLHGLVYNRTNPDNTSNTEKTEKAIVNWFNEFENIVVFLKRNPSVPYEQVGRIQNEEEAIIVDSILKGELLKHRVPFIEVESDIDKIEEIVELILKEA
jgi:hypothetical protein